jgi:hypothetical protein
MIQHDLTIADGVGVNRCRCGRLPRATLQVEGVGENGPFHYIIRCGCGSNVGEKGADKKIVVDRAIERWNKAFPTNK